MDFIAQTVFAKIIWLSDIAWQNRTDLDNLSEFWEFVCLILFMCGKKKPASNMKHIG